MTKFEKIIPLSVDEIGDEMDRQLPTVPDTASDEVSLRAIPRRGGIVNVPTLLTLNSKEFISEVYNKILGRDPDPEGLQHHLKLLAMGTDKHSILLGLRNSKEGKIFNSTLIGVRNQSRLDRIFVTPLIGNLARRLITRLPAYRLRQHVRSLEDIVRALMHNSEVERQDITDLQKQLAETAGKNQILALSARIDSARNRLDDQRKVAEANINRIIDRSRDQLSKEPWAAPLLLLADRQEETDSKLLLLNKALADVELIDATVRLLNEAFAPVSRQSGWPEQGAALVARAAEALRQQESRINNAEQKADSSHREMLMQAQRLTILLETVRRKSEPLDSGQLAAMIDEQDHLLDPLYVEFEARFRGSRSLIKTRQRVHLSVITQAGAGSPERQIVDVGAGRGEWLELLKEEELAAWGIDLNASMVDACKALGLSCIEGDAVAELANLPENCLGAITGFHIIEHLPFRVMVSLLDEALRVLAPGGLVLFETPNPANLQVGSRWFYLDPTHRNPIPGEMLAMIAEARGFVGVRIEPLHPMPQKFNSMDRVLGEELDALLHGPMDYALIAYKA